MILPIIFLLFIISWLVTKIIVAIVEHFKINGIIGRCFKMKGQKVIFSSLWKKPSNMFPSTN
jgi:hypothetical protein